MYLILSPELYILTASDLYLDAVGTRREAIVGKHIFEAFPADPDLPDADGVQNINASLQEVLKTGRTHHMPIQRYDVPDINYPGKFIQRYWDPSHSPVFNEQGEIQYIIQLATNVNDQIVIEQALEKAKVQQHQAQLSLQKLHQELIERVSSETHFRQLADLIPTKISNALPGGELTYFNKQWLEYSRLSFEELRDFGYLQILHPDEVAAFQAGLKEAASKGVPFEMEMRFRNWAGRYKSGKLKQN
jgi:PAS domain-containing protein